MIFTLIDLESGDAEFPITFALPSDERCDAIAEIDEVYNTEILRLQQQHTADYEVEILRQRHAEQIVERDAAIASGRLVPAEPLVSVPVRTPEQQFAWSKVSRQILQATRLRTRATFRAGISTRSLTERQKSLVDLDPDNLWWKRQPLDVVQEGARRFRLACEQGHRVDTTDSTVASTPSPAVENGRTGNGAATPVAVDAGAGAID